MSRNRCTFCLTAALIGLLLAAAGPAAPARKFTVTPGVIPPNSTYSDLSAAWWQWAFSQPVSSSPLFDTTGAFAANGQPSHHVFFLAGLVALSGDPLDAHAERTITIPTGTALFVPMLNSEFDNVGISPPLTVAQLRAAAALNADAVTSLFATIDGKSVQDLFAYRTLSPVFSYTLPATDNLYQFFGVDVSGTISPAVGDGFYLLLAPLTPGNHTLNFGGTTTNIDPISGQESVFRLNLTYHVTVKPGH